MKYNTDIFVKILQNLALADYRCYDFTYEYWDHVKELYEQKLFFAEVVRDEAGRMAQLNNIKLYRQGRQYLEELLTKKKQK